MTILVGQCSITLYCPGSFSLKDKRQLIESLLDRATDQFNVAGAEVDFQEHHRRAKIAFSTVSSSRRRIDQIFENLENMLSNEATIQVRNIDRTVS